jgi:hypothetical protein
MNLVLERRQLLAANLVCVQLLHRHELTVVEVQSKKNGTKSARTNNLAFLPAQCSLWLRLLLVEWVQLIAH